MSRRRRIALIAGGALLAAFVAAWSIIGLLFDGYLIPSASMDPTLGPGDRVVARSVAGDNVSRGDVIVYRAPGQLGASPPLERVARVVAVAGDVIGQERELLTINGEIVDERYLPAGTTTPGIRAVTVPPGHVFVMGDNRHNSADSRSFGPVPNEDVRRLVVVQWWPLGQFGGL